MKYANDGSKRNPLMTRFMRFISHCVKYFRAGIACGSNRGSSVFSKSKTRVSPDFTSGLASES